MQEVKLQNTEGDDFDAKIDKMVSQAEYNLTSSELSRLKELLKQNDSVFSKNDLDIGEFKEVEHSIDTGSAEPSDSGYEELQLALQKRRRNC